MVKITEEMFIVNWNKQLDAYKDISYDTTFTRIQGFPLYVELRIYPSTKDWKAISLYATDSYGGDVRKLKLKDGSREEVEKYITLLSQDKNRSAKLLKKLWSNFYFRGAKNVFIN